MLKLNKVHLSLLVLLIFAFITVGCGSASNSNSTPAVSSDNKEMSIAKEALQGETALADNFETQRMAEAGGGSGAIGEIAPSKINGSEEGFNQKLVYKAELTMEVGNYDPAVTELRNAIHQSGGYILQFKDGQYENEKGSTYTIKIPSEGFMTFIERLEGIEHKRFEREVGATDVTEEYVDLESRLKAKQVVEERLLEFMDKATKADDLVKFSEQLSGVQEEIEVIKGRVRYLDRNVAYSTVDLRLYETSSTLNSKDKQALPAKMSSALNGSVDALLIVLQGLLIFVSGALPVLLFLLIIGLPVFWLLRRAKRNRLATLTPATTDMTVISPQKQENDDKPEDPVL